MLIVPKKIGWRSDYSGIDSLESCVDRQHFLNYSKKITYEYNSRGFRDTEWPKDLSEVIWCVGDSFTVGIGQPHGETWPAMLQKKIGKRCINIGEDGCSNDKISLRVKQIYDLFKPKLIIVMWSYLHRRSTNDIDMHFDKSSFGAEEDLKNFVKNFQIANTLPTNMVNLLIPNAVIDLSKWKKNLLEYIFLKYNSLYKQQLQNILTFPQLDYARDCHHFDIQTSKHICNLIVEKIQNFDKLSK